MKSNVLRYVKDDLFLTAVIKRLQKKGVEIIDFLPGRTGPLLEYPALIFNGESYYGEEVARIAIEMELPVHDLRRVWDADLDGLSGPRWEISFVRA